METVGGRIVDVRPGTILVEVPYTNWQRFALRQYEDCIVGFRDSREISDAQRRKAYVLLHEIVEWSGDSLKKVKKVTKREYLKTQVDSLKDEYFSLSDCDMTTAREYIDYLIEFIIDNDVPCSQPLYKLCEDVKQYVWQNLIHKKCCICGKHADLHHVQKVGMGRNRDEICHIGMECLPLCRIHHQEAHQHGDGALLAKYHLESYTIDEEIAKIYGLNGENEDGS